MNIARVYPRSSWSSVSAQLMTSGTRVSLTRVFFVMERIRCNEIELVGEKVLCSGA